MPKLVVFDLDNTLTESRTAITKDTALLLRDLLRQTRVAVISGAAFWQFEKQLLGSLGATDKELANLYILTTSGAELWAFDNGWKRMYLEKFSNKDKKRVKQALMDVLFLDEKGLKPLLDDRDSGMTYSALGKDAPVDIKKPWDPDQKKRIALVEQLSPLLTGLGLKIGGTTSIDITNEGIDKAFGVRKIIDHLKLSKDEAVFIGDALFPGGNDEPVKNTGVETIETKGPEDTRQIMKRILKAPETIEASSISLGKDPIAFFCAEYALDDDSLRYAGGLGVLAADYLYEASDMDLPVACIGLWYADQSTEKYPLIVKNGKPLTIDIPFERTTIKARARARRFGSVWLILIETDIADVHSALYSLEDYTWVRQDLVLGMGGAKMLEALGIAPKVYHLNEGHTGFAAFELVAREAAKSADKSIPKAIRAVREKIVATKHTILKAGVKNYEIDFMRYFEPYCDGLGISAKEMFKAGTSAEERVFSATHFLIASARIGSAVSDLHARFEKEAHPKSELLPITNGVYMNRWVAREWQSDPSDEKIWEIKSGLRKELIEYANSKTGSKLDPDVCTVVWSRRFASYKRPDMLISDIERLKKLATGEQRLQFILSGKVYQEEPTATAILNRILALARDPEWKDKIAYLPDFGIPVAHRLVRGADVWLNTPRRGKEACGTSGMKAGGNGALQMSISDGWVEEVKWNDIGWILPEENTAAAMYSYLETEVAPLFYAKRKEWIKRMKKTIAIVEKNFTATRMLKDYIKKLYKL